MKHPHGQILLLRHGQTEPDPVFRYTGQREVPLSRDGRDQARHWGEVLRAAGIAAVYASPLGRCLETAQIIGKVLNQPVHAVPALKEIALGEWEGLTKAAVKERYPGAYEARGEDMAGFRPPGGESFSDLLERVRPFALNCRQSRESLLAITHAGVIRVLSCWAAGTPLGRLFDYRPKPAAMTVIGFGRHGPFLRASGVFPEDFLKKLEQLTEE